MTNISDWENEEEEEVNTNNKKLDMVDNIRDFIKQRKNNGLKKYEVKAPDLDFIRRKNNSKVVIDNTPSRYEYEKSKCCWRQKGEGHNKLSATLMFTGDITFFDKQFEEAKTENGYDFHHEFEEIKAVFNQADLVVGNLETVVCERAPYRSEKIVIEENFYCNSPSSVLAAIKSSGIDVLTNANNHDIDVGAVGIGDTIDNLEKFGFIHTGTFKDFRKRYEIIMVEGIKVGIVAFTDDHNGLTCNLISAGVERLLNDYSYERAKNIMEEARSDGAEIVIACVHWGKENWNEIHSKQYKIAREIASLGYDCIVGSHPHVLQKFEWISAGKKRIPVYFSLGNFISHNVNNKKARSIIACIKLVKKESGVQIKCSAIPIITGEQYNGRRFVVLPLQKDSKSERCVKKLKRIKREIGNDIKLNFSFTLKDYVEDEVEHLPKFIPEKVDLSLIEEFPFPYEDNHFTYDVFQDHVKITGMKESYITPSCTIPETVLGLPLNESDDGVFENNGYLRKIKSIGIPYVGERFCKNCKSLEGFRIGQETSVIRAEAFEGCCNLYTIVMKSGLKVIEKRAFANCSNLKSVKLPSNVSEIADDAFIGCKRAVFYVERNSYAEKYVKKHRYKLAYMELRDV